MNRKDISYTRSQIYIKLFFTPLDKNVLVDAVYINDEVCTKENIAKILDRDIKSGKLEKIANTDYLCLSPKEILSISMIHNKAYDDLIKIIEKGSSVDVIEQAITNARKNWQNNASLTYNHKQDKPDKILEKNEKITKKKCDICGIPLDEEL